MFFLVLIYFLSTCLGRHTPLSSSLSVIHGRQEGEILESIEAVSRPKVDLDDDSAGTNTQRHRARMEYTDTARTQLNETGTDKTEMSQNEPGSDMLFCAEDSPQRKLGGPGSSLSR